MKQNLPGLLLTLALAVAAALAAQAPFAPFTLAGGQHPIGVSSLAILFGIVLVNLVPLSNRFLPGIRFCTRVVLPLGIVLLGARLAFGDLMKVGTTGLLLSLVSISTCALVTALLIRTFRLPVKLTTLIGVGTAICGGSAIAAAAPVIEADDEDISWSVAAVALLGLVLMFVLPVVGHGLGVDSTAFGMWAGLTIHQTPQVVAAGLAYGGDAGEVATLIKLVRVTLLAPMVFLLGLVYARTRHCSHGAAKVGWLGLLPPFVVGFLVMAALRSIGWLDFTLPFGGSESPRLMDLARVGDRFALATAMAAIGLETRLSAFRRTGLQPLAAGVVVAVATAAATYAAIYFLV
jgi:uncharacterized integral membrane protein (TIGR00698 family)